MKYGYPHASGKKGQFSILAALLMMTILVFGIITTYSAIRNTLVQDSQQTAYAIDELKSAINRLLDFTVGYYGSILQVTANITYAIDLTWNYFYDSFDSIAHSYPKLNPSFTVNSLNVSSLWFEPSSYSSGTAQVAFSIGSLGIYGVKFDASSILRIDVQESLNPDEARVNITRNGRPELALKQENFFFYSYSYSDSTWKLVHPEGEVVAFVNGTYVLQIPEGVPLDSYMLQVVDQRGITISASYVSKYVYTLTWNTTLYSSLTQDTIVVEALQNGTLRWLGQNLQLLTQGRPIPPIPAKTIRINQTINGVNKEVPFQIEDWNSQYRVAVGLTSNASIFSNRNMIVSLVNHNVSEVALWWDGRDVANQTSFAWENIYFCDDNPDEGILTNGELTLNFKGRKEYLYVDSFDNTYSDWLKVGSPPYINNDFSNYIEGISAESQWVSYNPSGYNLVGSTTYVSGSLSDLQSNNGAYMIFRGSSGALTPAFISYRSNTGTSYLNSPKNQIWDGSSWGSENEMATAGSSVNFVRVAYCPLLARYLEKIVVTLSNDGYLDAYVWTGSSWQVTNNIGYVGTTVDDYRSYDITYERSSGRAMLVYAIYSTDTARDLAYKIWNGAQWSSEAYINDPSSSDLQYYWVKLASYPLTTGRVNEIALIACENSYTSDANGWIWNGNSWGNFQELESNIASRTTECISVEYEQLSGNAMFIWSYEDTYADEGYMQSRKWTGSWGSELPQVSLGYDHIPYWFTLKADPSSNRLMVVSIDSDYNLYTIRWDGTSWTRDNNHDYSIDTSSSRCADFEWEPSGSKGLLIWGTSSGSLSYKTFSAPSTWSGISTISASGTHPWVQLRRNPLDVSGDIKILGATLNSYYDLGALKWDGSTLTNIGNSIFTLDTTTTTYECFDIRFQIHVQSTLKTLELEFTGTSNKEMSALQLMWSVDSCWSTGSVAVIIQLYNYNVGGYPITGDGYISYISSATPNFDQTVSQTITVNPENFRDASGNWKVKIKAVATTEAELDLKADWVEFKTLTTLLQPKQGWFGFKNPIGSGTIQSVKIQFETKCADDDYFVFWVNDGTTTYGPYTISNLPEVYDWKEYSLSSLLNTWTKINNAKIYLEYRENGGATSVWIRRCRLFVEQPEPESGFMVISTVGTSTADAEFMRINGEEPMYGADPAYVIHHGIVRDIVQQEPEWSGGAYNCPNVYGQIVITLPANATYYTYALRAIFVDSLQTRIMTDFSALQLSAKAGQPKTENGISGGMPVVSSSEGLFYNLSNNWAHHWSEFISANSGSGIMFTTDANYKLYAFDPIASLLVGALKISSSTKTIEVNPVGRLQFSFTTPQNITWYGTVVTFDDEPIYPDLGGNIGLWIIVEYPPTVTVS